MGVHVVRQGECLSTIAARHGIPSWKTLYDDPANADLRRLRPNPNLLYPGDRVVIPAPTKQKTVSCATGQGHGFVVALPMAKLRLVLKGADGQGLASKRYKLEARGWRAEGRTDGNGKIEQDLPLSVREAHLSVWLKDDLVLQYRLLPGALDPHDLVTGVQARLRNLGFHAGPVDGRPRPELEQALRHFQRKAGLAESGRIDQATANRLRDTHDGP